MRRETVHTFRMMFKATAVCLLVLAAAPAIADQEIPEEWVGIWEMDIAIYDCDTNALIFSTTSLDTICPGSAFEDPDPGDITIECTSSADANTYTNHCEGSEVVIPGCTATFVFDLTGTRNGDSYTQVGTTMVTYAGAACGLFPDSCQRMEVSGTRSNNDPGPCESTPVEGRPWATVKSYYR